MLALAPQRGIDSRAVTTAHAPLAQGELALLLQVSRAVARHRERDALLAALAEALRVSMPLERLAVSIPGTAGSVVHTCFARESPPTCRSEPDRPGSALDWASGNRRTLLITRADEIRERFPETYRSLVAAGLDSMAVLPLVAGERAVGALALMAREQGAWNACSRQLLDEIASSVAIGVEHALAYAHLEGMGEELRVLADVSAAIGSHLERDELFGALARSLQDILPFDRFGIELPLPPDQLQGHLLTPEGALAKRTHAHVLPAAGTMCDWVIRNRQWLVAARRDELADRFPTTLAVMTREGMESVCALPLLTGERCRGVIFFMAAKPGAYAELRRGLLDQVASAVAVALDDCLAHEEVQRLRDQLAAENVYLRDEIRQAHGFDEIIGRSPALLRTLQGVELVAGTESTVLILGETGTGKELVARAIHARSRRAGRPLIKVNCAAIPAGLVESELFGHERGAFTGATAQRAGRFELADGGTLFLDEVGELPLEAQVKLLRVLQEREFERVGGSRTLRTDVRVIAATNRDLLAEVAIGSFRQDLYYRLNVFPVALPALRERPEDIELIALHCLQRHARRAGRETPALPVETVERLRRYSWPGNVRELENVIERALILSPGNVLEIDPSLLERVPGVPVAAPSQAAAAAPDSSNLADVERRHLLRALERCGWVIEGPRGAAQQLGLHPNTLRGRLKKLGLRRPTG
jgi:formate hydrogenlyase transcriptional activator